MSDEELVKRAQNGDVQAFMALAERYETVIFRLAFALLRHREDAEDATQDIFVHAFQRLQTLRDAGSFALWLRRLAIRICLRYRRRRITELEFVEPLGDEYENEILFRTDLDPETEAEKAELRMQVRKAIAELPEPFQIVVLLYHMDGLSYDEIAQVLGVPVGTVRSRLSRARAMLREKLAPFIQQSGSSSPNASFPEINSKQVMSDAV